LEDEAAEHASGSERRDSRRGVLGEPEVHKHRAEAVHEPPHLNENSVSQRESTGHSAFALEIFHPFATVSFSAWKALLSAMALKGGKFPKAKKRRFGLNGKIAVPDCGGGVNEEAPGEACEAIADEVRRQRNQDFREFEHPARESRLTYSDNRTRSPMID
jgi:hypothetical protein